ncbi:Crp/Fnr family transcriptional regulator [Marinicella sp. S1101]|uniref:Crp/Fnr family transcriptional regulator n=1 Tax=Marinicella marina TaxID=2996016 RepID=UPI002260AED5|nr:Crp/Fnr family transcriptional regulator [Marinicella marina]MCX7552450.1 Crp/Fnr family transcriptional regulator [Marinicella marina]MDJ1139326.1 Crp/Fnr family transcriptional regulator [Marinicella marina]
MIHKDLQPKVVNALRENVMFSGMNDEQFDRILKIADLVKQNPEQMLFQQDTPLSHIFFVYDGAIKLVRSTIKGDEKIIEVVFPGRTFAEGVLFSGAPKYPVTAVAMRQSMVVSIQATSFLNLLKESADLCINMLGHLSVRLHWMVKELDKQTLHNASFRVIDYFLSQVNEAVTDEFNLTLSVPKRDIASRLSIKPETFSRALKSLENKQLIKVKEKHIKLKNVSELRALLETEAL